MNSGKLIIVPTPIGNLKDITLRALEVLKEADLIAAEDTRQTLKLLSHYSIKKTLVSYHKHNEFDKSETLVNKIKEGNTIALVSDAGMPGISDPGSVIIKKCIEEDIPVEVLPGASASVTALVYSGFNTERFIFYGFIPRENKDRKQMLEEYKNRKETIIFYEAPHRINETLSFLKENFAERRVAICRELTKLHEEICRVSLEEAQEIFKKRQPKGEFVIVLEGKSEEVLKKEEREKWEELTIEEHIEKYLNLGINKKEAVKKVAKDRSLSKSEVYKFSINL